VTTRNGFRVDEVPGPRWDLALGIIEDAGPSVFIDGDVTVGIHRWHGWKGTDGKIHIASTPLVARSADRGDRRQGGVRRT